MKSCILILFLLSANYSAKAQDVVVKHGPDSFDDDSYGEGGTRKVEIEESKAIRVIKTTYIDPNKKTQEIRIVRFDIEGGFIPIAIDSTVSTFVDGDEVIIEKYTFLPGERHVYEEEEKIKQEWRIIDGKKTAVIIKGEKSTVLEGRFKFNLHTKKYEKIPETPPDLPKPDITTLSSFPKAEFFIGYSYMRAQDGARVLSMPLGANAGLVYNLNSRLGLAVDASYHYKKDGDQKFDREFLLTGIQYRLNGDCCDDDEPPGIFTHLLIGYARDGFRYMDTKNSGGAFAAAIGGGLDVKLSHKTSLIFKVDAKSVFTGTYWPTHLEGGVGLKWDMGTKSPPEKSDKAFMPTKN